MLQVNAYSRRSSDGSVSPVMDRVLFRVFPERIAFCGEEIDEILDADVINAWITRAIFARFRFRDSRARTVPAAQNIPIAIDENRL